MRHLVNFGLLFSFLTLAVTGVMAFVLPFSLATTRIHIVFGAATLVLVGLHLVERTDYFSRKLFGKRKGRTPVWVAAIAAVWAWLLASSLFGWWPAPALVEQGYEARHRAEIVRSSPMAGFLEKEGAHFAAREPGEEADAGVGLLLRWREGLERAPALAVWAETTTGTMIETIYLDESLAFSERPEWRGEATPRHHILPIWRHRYTMVSGIDPTGEVDAFTAATPTHSFSLEDYLQLGEEKEFVLCVELNAAGDPNEAWPDPHLGQPSLFYTAFIEVDAAGPESAGGEPRSPWSLLELTGHGGGAEESGAVQYDLEGVTTAADLLDLALARVEERR